ACPVRHWRGTRIRKPVNCWRYMTAAIRRCALSRMTRSIRAGWWRTVTREGRRCATATTIPGGWWSS
ncbi:rhsC domain protein, partial [Escherichia coli 5.2239]